jgi:SAM-dependent methyltransferase
VGNGDQNERAAGWDAYWRHTREAAAHKGGGPQDQVLGGFWNALFLEFLPRHPNARLLDVACGNGAVTDYALRAAQQLGRAQPVIYALDRSPPALAQWRQRFSSATGVVADAARAPFADQRFDLVASQFGVGYAANHWRSNGAQERVAPPPGRAAVRNGHRGRNRARRANEPRQKVVNFRRDPRASLLAESGEEYGQLKSVLICARTEIIDDVESAVDALVNINTKGQP